MPWYTLTRVVIYMQWCHGIHQLRLWYTCSDVMVYINSGCGIHAVMSWYTSTQVVVYIYILLFHVTVYLFSALFNLIIWLYINLCCHLLIRLILLIHFACTYNRFYSFLIYFVVCRYILLSSPCHLPINAAWNSWNVIRGMCLVVTRTSLAAI